MQLVKAPPRLDVIVTDYLGGAMSTRQMGDAVLAVL